MNNLSSTAAIVIALTSPIITELVLTCESKAKQILNHLAKELTLTDDAYQITLQQAGKDLIPWLGMVKNPRCLAIFLLQLVQIPSFPPSI
jgi:hypothetical protein